MWTLQEAVHVTPHFLHPQTVTVPSCVCPCGHPTGHTTAATFTGRPPPPPAGSAATATSSSAVPAAAATGDFAIYSTMRKKTHKCFADKLETRVGKYTCSHLIRDCTHVHTHKCALTFHTPPPHSLSVLMCIHAYRYIDTSAFLAYMYLGR